MPAVPVADQKKVAQQQPQDKTSGANPEVLKKLKAQKVQTVGGKRRRASGQNQITKGKGNFSNFKALGCNPVQGLQELMVVHDKENVEHYKFTDSSRQNFFLNQHNGVYAFSQLPKPISTTEKKMEESGHEAAGLISSNMDINSLLASQLGNIQAVQEVSGANQNGATNSNPEGEKPLDFQAIAEEGEKDQE